MACRSRQKLIEHTHQSVLLKVDSKPKEFSDDYGHFGSPTKFGIHVHGQWLFAPERRKYLGNLQKLLRFRGDGLQKLRLWFVTFANHLSSVQVLPIKAQFN